MTQAQCPMLPCPGFFAPEGFGCVGMFHSGRGSETVSCLISCCKHKNIETMIFDHFSLKTSDYGSWPKQHETEVRLVSRPIH